jgi:hypothetical protein
MTTTGGSGVARQRRPWVLAGVAVGLVAVAATVAAVLHRTGTSSPATATCDVPSTPPVGVTTPADRAPDGGGIRVVEKGFTQISGSAYTVSTGAVLANTSGQYAYRTRVTVSFLDSQHRSASDSGSHVFEIPVIRPGQRIALGDWTYILAKPASQPATVASIDIQVGATSWLPADEGRRTFAEVTSTTSRVQRSTVARNTATVYYSATSAYCRDVSLRGTAIVFRDGAGRIVGGSFDPNPIDHQCPRGVSHGIADADRSTPVDIDEGKTQIDLYCDIGPDMRPAIIPGGP